MREGRVTAEALSNARPRFATKASFAAETSLARTRPAASEAAEPARGQSKQSRLRVRVCALPVVGVTAEAARVLVAAASAGHPVAYWALRLAKSRLHSRARACEREPPMTIIVPWELARRRRRRRCLGGQGESP